MAIPRNESSILGSSTRIVGRVSGSGALRIAGSVTGDVSVTGATEILEGARIEGDVQAEALEISGTLLGDAMTSGPIAVRAGASVRGALKGSQVTIEPGSEVAVVLDTAFDLELPSRRRGR